MTVLTSALQRVDPTVVGVEVDGPDTFVAYPDRVLRYKTPPEVSYALATSTMLDADIELTLGPPA